MQTLEDPTNGYKDLWYPTHKKLCDFVEKYGKEGNTLLILLPRGWIKSYLVTVGWTLQRVLRNAILGRREHIIISNATLPNAKEFLEKIKYNVRFNDFLRGVFNRYIPKDPENDAERWTQNEIQFSGNRIETGSVEGNLVSRHYKVLINDDLVNRENSQTAEQIEKVIDWWKLSRSLMTANGLEIIIGTRWSYDDLYGYIIEKFFKPTKEEKEQVYAKPFLEWHKGKYHLFQMSCWLDPVNRTGSTYPNLFPEEKLKEIENEQADRFGGQYCNDPLAMSITPFKLTWLQKMYRQTEVPTQRHTIMTMDLSAKDKATSDYSAMVIVDAAVDKKIYIRYADQKKVSDKELCEWIVKQACIYQPDTIGIESEKYETMMELLEWIVPHMARMKMIPPGLKEYAYQLPYMITELRHRGRPKDVRIRNLTGWLEGGKVLWPIDGAEQLRDQLLRYPSSKYNDLPDALAYVLDLLVFPKEDDPEKVLEVPEELKRTQEERIEKEWEDMREAAYTTDFDDEGDDLL